MEEKREKSIFRLLLRNSNFTWFLVTFALNISVITLSGVATCVLHSVNILVTINISTYKQS